jgi:mono/diheme cytochrome c family protein
MIHLPSASLLAIAALPLLVACSSDDSGADGDADRASTIAGLTGDATGGESVYSTNCTSCHGTDAKSGSENMDVAAFARSSKDAAIAQILEGGDGMPSFEALTDQQVADVVAYLASLD